MVKRELGFRQRPDYGQIFDLFFRLELSGTVFVPAAGVGRMRGSTFFGEFGSRPALTGTTLVVSRGDDRHSSLTMGMGFVMFENMMVTVRSYLAFYTTSLAGQWQHMSPSKYGIILIGIGVFGWLLMKSQRRK